MRYKLAALVLCLAALNARAEDRALLDDQDVWKLYTTPQVSFSDVNGDMATMAGVGFGTILNDQWTFGIAGHILVNDLDEESGDGVPVDQWDWWYAGFEVGYIFVPTSLFHPNVSLLAAGGEIELSDETFGGGNSESFFLLEPELSLCLNLHETWELGVSVGYRWIDGVDLVGVDEDDLSDVTGSVFLRATEF